MYNQTLAKNSYSRANQYLVKEIMESTPQQLLLRVYDVAIISCKKEDLPKTNAALQELINTLRFDDEEAKDISIGLYRLYQFCQDQMRKKNYDVVIKILTELKETWVKAFSTL